MGRIGMGMQLILELACLLVTLYAESLAIATDLLPDTSQCGQSFHTRIVGGSSTHVKEYPWTALITFRKKNDTRFHRCGGTLINNRYVLTAAHCLPLQIDNVNKAPVRLGEWDMKTNPDCEVNKNGQKYCADPHLDVGIEEFILHPKFTNQCHSKTHDIALIRLNRYVNFTEFIQPVCLPIQPSLRSKTYDDLKMVAIGWGRMAGCGKATVKQKVYLTGVNLDVCKRLYRLTKISIIDTHLCAGVEGKGVCFGDSGGPLVYPESVDSRVVYVLVGVTSFGFTTCCENGGTGVFTRVDPYMDWIQKNLRP